MTNIPISYYIAKIQKLVNIQNIPSMHGKYSGQICLISLSNKANLRDLIAATGLVILLKLDSNHWFFVLCVLEIWQMTLKNKRSPLLCCFKLCASFHSHQWIQTGVTVRKCPIWVKIEHFFSRVTLRFDGWPWKSIGHLFKATSALCLISSQNVNSNWSYN